VREGCSVCFLGWDENWSLLVTFGHFLLFFVFGFGALSMLPKATFNVVKSEVCHTGSALQGN